MTIRALWATPRTASTAFERMVIERGDHVVLDEPWSRAYYFGPDRRSERYPLVFPESTYAAVTGAVVRLGQERDVFVKDMAYQALPGLTDDAIREMTHTFLVREPGAALRSLRREWPDVTEDEAGYAAQRRLFDRVREVTGRTPVVVQSDELRADPDGVVGRWCALVGVDHRPEAMRWHPGMRPEWQLWRSWYEGVASSSGFRPPTADGGTRPPDQDVLVAAAAPHYEYLRAHAVPAVG